uniref:Cordon-bleu WH2 repeat protein n=1 Tax=Bos indicus x Bos taurus TaxID=30522 RepID=A0A4W2HL81_BOBOX
RSDVLPSVRPPRPARKAARCCPLRSSSPPPRGALPGPPRARRLVPSLPGAEARGSRRRRSGYLLGPRWRPAPAPEARRWQSRPLRRRAAAGAVLPGARRTLLPAPPPRVGPSPRARAPACLGLFQPLLPFRPGGCPPPARDGGRWVSAEKVNEGRGGDCERLTRGARAPPAPRLARRLHGRVASLGGQAPDREEDEGSRSPASWEACHPQLAQWTEISSQSIPRAPTEPAQQKAFAGRRGGGHDRRAAQRAGEEKCGQREKTVRLVVNYLRTQKAVVRVSPEVPLQSILPVICAKCEVSPEHVVLLRDNVAGEELELSKSLNELGIKELYAWDNKRVLLTKTKSEPSLSCRETFRKSSLSNDETDKEKKKFLGFFKVNKRSNNKGCLTTPNSPCVNPRSVILGPSLSLGNISGVSVKSDLKKRRAPPPPTLPRAGPPVQDKTSEKMSLGSQIDLQKKKRRAPAPPPPQPPPPSPLVPPRTEDREEGRKGRTGVGRQVPQKPPRGAARAPPQLVLPPPPPYPPPAADATEPPLGAPGEGAAPEASSPRPAPELYCCASFPTHAKHF